MKTKEEIRNWLLENAVDEEGDLMLDYLDFSEFNGDVFIGRMKVKGDLFQSYQEVQGSLSQGDQEVQGNLFQDSQKVQGDLYQRNSRYGGTLYEEPSTKMLKEITIAELEELGYRLKEKE